MFCDLRNEISFGTLTFIVYENEAILKNDFFNQFKVKKI